MLGLGVFMLFLTYDIDLKVQHKHNKKFDPFYVSVY